MIVFLPKPAVRESTLFLHPAHLLQSASSANSILAVLHEEHPMRDALRLHPSVIQYTDHSVWLCTYAMGLLDRYMAETGTSDEVNKIYADLSRALDLATTDEYDMETPPWLGHKRLHDSHLAWLVTAYPELYPGSMVDVDFAARLFFPG